MEILSYPVGLLVGLFSVLIDLGPSARPAELLLDSRPACVVTKEAPGCMVDLGPAPRVHLLELIRTDDSGRVVGRVQRWVNRGAAEPELRIAGHCDLANHVCAFDVSWAHPRSLDPTALSISIDGVKVYSGKEHQVRVKLRSNGEPRILVGTIQFPDGSRAGVTRALSESYPEEAHASLRAVPIRTAAPQVDPQMERLLRAAGWPVQTVEQGDFEIAFVVEPGALDQVSALYEKVARIPSVYSAIPREFQAMSVVVADGPLTTYSPDQSPRGWLGALMLLPHRAPTRFVCVADAVSAAGYALAGSGRRRAVVLIVSGNHVDSSAFSTAQARAYLREVMVPLSVWKTGNKPAAEWGDLTQLSSPGDFVAAISQLRASLDQQRIAWMGDGRDPASAPDELAPGLNLVGRGVTAPVEQIGVGIVPDAKPGQDPAWLGPEGGAVHQIAFSSDGALVLCGTDSGLFRSRDAGVHWERPGSQGVLPGPVRSLAISNSLHPIAWAGTDDGLFKSSDDGDHWAAIGALVGQRVQVVLSSRVAPARIFVGTADSGIFFSLDEGQTWVPTQVSYGHVSALVETATGAILASGHKSLYRSEESNASFRPAGDFEYQVLSLAEWPEHSLTFAGTAGGGVFQSRDNGSHWSATSLDRAYVTGLVVVPGKPGRVVAATTEGLIQSSDFGKTWSLVQMRGVECVAASSSGTLLAGGLRGVMREDASSLQFAPSNSGLLASRVYAAIVGPSAAAGTFAATTAGLAARNGDSPRLEILDPRLPPEVYSLAFSPGPRPDLFVGWSGGLGRFSIAARTWKWTPSYPIYRLASDSDKPEVAFAATRSSVLRTQDGGAHWASSTAGLPKPFVLDVALRRSGEPVVFAATAGAGVYQSADGGQSWRISSNDLANMLVRSIVPEQPGSEAIWAGTDRGLFLSNNFGRSWAPVLGLPRGTVYSVVVDRRDPQRLFVGSVSGLFTSTDRGKHWEPVAGTRSVGTVIALFLDENADRLLVGTVGSGLVEVVVPRP